jgi:hypothetical protein
MTDVNFNLENASLVQKASSKSFIIQTEGLEPFNFKMEVPDSLAPTKRYCNHGGEIFKQKQLKVICKL